MRTEVEMVVDGEDGAASDATALGALRAWWTVGGFVVSALLTAAAVLSGCGEMAPADAQTMNDFAVGSQSCIPQQAIFCACGGGGEGVQVCDMDGTYGPCDCSASVVGSGMSGDSGAPDVGSDMGSPPPAQPATLTCEGGGGYGDEDLEDLMYPGGDCIGCHADEDDDDAPMYTAAGTVMLGLHERDNCGGLGGATVEITGADGAVTTLRTNRVGNFFTTRRIATPYTAVVRYQGRTLPMIGPQTDLNCANCHTARGTGGAPGRLIAP